jgi:hypothetical protein
MGGSHYAKSEQLERDSKRTGTRTESRKARRISLSRPVQFTPNSQFATAKCRFSEVFLDMLPTGYYTKCQAQHVTLVAQEAPRGKPTGPHQALALYGQLHGATLVVLHGQLTPLKREINGVRYIELLFATQTVTCPPTPST